MMSRSDPAVISRLPSRPKAMTAFRPFKERTLSVEEAMKILEKETPAKYDPLVLKAWIRLMRRVLPARLTQENTGTVAAPGTPVRNAFRYSPSA